MSETTQHQTAPKPEAEELSTLRKLTSELRSKNTAKKTRISELEAASTAMQSKLDTANTELRKLTVELPLRGFAEAASTAPAAFITALLQDYRVEMKNGKLALLTLQGEPVMHEGKVVPLELDAVRKLLLATKDESRLQLFRSIIISTRASGATNPGPQRSGKASSQQNPTQHFGLR